jgi:acyl transferase domain-containing protein
MVLIRMIDAIARGRMPRVPGLGALNDGITLKPGFDILRDHRPWPRLESAGRPVPRRAAIHSLAVGGVNAHMLVEQAPARPAATDDLPLRLFVFSEHSPAALRAYAEEFAAHCNQAIARRTPPDPAAIEYVLKHGRELREHRLAIVAATAVELVDKLWAWLRTTQPRPDVFAGGHGAAAATMPPTQDLASLGRAWADGAPIDWPQAPPRRAHLPGNRLQREVCSFVYATLLNPQEAGAC